jgi:hypothetical protein
VASAHRDRPAGWIMATQLLLLSLLFVASSAAPPPPVNVSTFPITGVDPSATCLDGMSDPGVQVWINPAGSSTWVLTLGSVSPGLGSWMCFSESSCAQFALPKAAPPPPPPPCPWCPPGALASAPGLAQGMQSQNCSINPLFCHANQAVLAACDFSLYLGTGTAQATFVDGKNASSPGFNRTVTAHFNGRKILAASLKRLAPLGLAEATDVILAGVTFGGTAAILNGDFIGNELRMLAPKLKRYKIVPADANHPQYGTGLAMSRNVHRDPANPSEDSWLTAAFKYAVTFSNAQPSLPPACVAAHASQPELCLYTDNALPYVETPTFVVQQMPGVWDYQCQFFGQGGGAWFMQIQCTVRYDLNLVTVVQYPDCASPHYIENFTIPLQHKQLQDATKFNSSARHGGFYFSCYLGSYFHENYQTTYPLTVQRLARSDGVWKQIEVEGVSMHDAIAGWWNDSTTATAPYTQTSHTNPHWHADRVWNATGKALHPVYAHSNCDPGAKVRPRPHVQLRSLGLPLYMWERALYVLKWSNVSRDNVARGRVIQASCVSGRRPRQCAPTVGFVHQMRTSRLVSQAGGITLLWFRGGPTVCSQIPRAGDIRGTRSDREIVNAPEPIFNLYQRETLQLIPAMIYWS